MAWAQAMVRISINAAPCKPKTWRTLCHLHTKRWITLQGHVSYPQEHSNGSLIRREPKLRNVQNMEVIIHHDNKKDKIINSKLPKLDLCEVITERGEKNTAFRMGNGADYNYVWPIIPQLQRITGTSLISATALNASKTSSKQTRKGSEHLSVQNKFLFNTETNIDYSKQTRKGCEHLSVQERFLFNTETNRD